MLELRGVFLGTRYNMSDSTKTVPGVLNVTLSQV